MKKFTAFIIAVMTLFALTGCVHTDTPPAPGSIDINALGAVLNGGCVFGEMPAHVEDTEFALDSLGADKALVKQTDEGFAVYKAVCASTPEIILIIEAIDENAAKELNGSAVKNWIEKNIEGYESYGPAQVPKLKSRVNKVLGNYVFLIVSADNAGAEKLLDEQIKSR